MNRNRYPNHNVIRSLVLLCLLLPSLAAASTTEKKSQELEQLRARIAELRQVLDRDRSEYGQLRRELRQSEERIGELAASLHKIEGDIKVTRSELKRLRREYRQLEGEVAEQRDLLSGQVRAAYLTGRQEYLKILLNQQDPARVGRVLAYYDYFNRARSERIDTLLVTLERLATVRSELDSEVARLDGLHQRQGREKQALEQSQAERKAVVAKLRREISSNDERLGVMLTQEKELQKLLESLREALADIPAAPGNHKPFAKLKGRLEWPLKGRLLASYGAPRKVGGLRWQGVLISAREGEEVRAVSYGRIAFADWLRGYGLLVIIDHGDGYMSLYGHNQSLFKEVGDWVEAGEVIATAGSSGGAERSALYFEIRREGKPTNPIRWVRR